MSEQRYSDEEVREIFARAASSEALTPPRSSRRDGFTLAELQSIGREAGLEPSRVAEAAASLDAQRGTLPRRTSWGMPVGVGRVIDLPRAPTDREWEMLVAELRTTFGARGRVTSQGGLREWSNGNLVAAVEPTESGYRLRLGTLKGDAALLNTLGVAGLALGAFEFLQSGMLEIFDPLLFGALGMGALLANIVRLPRWADRREQQMEHIAGRASALLTPRGRIEGAERGG
jgi:hypothetical protein